MLFLFCGAVFTSALLQRGNHLWLVPGVVETAAGADLVSVVTRRHRAVVLNAGLLAIAFGSASALLDALNAAGGFTPGAIGDYLLRNQGGLARVATVALLALALALAGSRRLRIGSVLGAAAALGALALGGHAAATSNPGLAVTVVWIHLLAGAVWLGGIALIVLTWGPALRRGGSGLRAAVAQHVLPRFGRVALPAFVLVAGTGVLNAIIELGRISALWDTAYGRVLVIKVAFVGVIATLSFVHVFVLRPRMLSATSEGEAGRRHWRLLRSEPVLGCGVAVAVALLVTFPPPRSGVPAAARADAALAVPCDPCPLPLARSDELSVAEQGGSDLVTALIRRRANGLTGQVRVIDERGQPSSSPFEIEGANTIAVSCGIGCRRFSITSNGASPAVLRVNVKRGGREYPALLPTRWLSHENAGARRLLLRAQATMRRLRSVRMHERVQSVPGVGAATAYRLQAPDRLAYVTAITHDGTTRTTVTGESVVIGKKQWQRPAGSSWQRAAFGGGLAFQTRSWFTWTTYSQAVRLLNVHREHGRRLAVLALADPGTPAWWRLTIDLATTRVLRSRLITTAHFMTQRYSAFNARSRILAPRNPVP